MHQATCDSETPKTITIVGRVIKSGDRRLISVPFDYHALIDSLNVKRVKIQIEPLA